MNVMMSLLKPIVFAAFLGFAATGASAYSVSPAAYSTAASEATDVVALPNDGDESGCRIMSGSLVFDHNSSEFTEAIQASLDLLGGEMKGNACRVVVVGSGGGNKYSTERIDAVVEYMNKKFSLGSDRFIRAYSGHSDKYQIVYRLATPDDEKMAK